MILGLFDLLLDRRDTCRGGVDELFSLAEIEQRGYAAALPLLCQPKEVLTVFQRYFGAGSLAVRQPRVRLSESTTAGRTLRGPDRLPFLPESWDRMEHQRHSSVTCLSHAGGKKNSKKF